MRSVNRTLLAVGVAVAALAATTTQGVAYAAPSPGPAAAQVQAAAAGTGYKEKLAVAVKFGRGEDASLPELEDRDFVIAIWNIVKDDADQVEVRIAAEAAFSTEPETVDAASAEFILTGVYEAFDRDVDRERREAEAKRLSDEARSRAAASIDVVADATLLNGTDGDFARLIWELVAEDVKWPKVKAAARAARDGSDADRTAFIASGLAAAAKEDVDDRIRQDAEKTAEQIAAELARAAKKQAANVIGLPVTEELLNTPDRDFIIIVWNHADDGSEVQAAAISATRSLDAAVWKTFIDTGVRAAKDRDIQIALDRKYAADKKLAQDIITAATKAGDRNLVWWTTKALNGTPDALDLYLRVGQYDLILNTSFETGEVQPTWSNTAAWKNAVTNVKPICCSLTTPELGVRSEGGKTGTNALMYSGLDNNATKSFAYLKTMAVSRITVKPDTWLSYWVKPQHNAPRPEARVANSSCVAVDLVTSDAKNLRDITTALASNNKRPHPAHQCNAAAKANVWTEVKVHIGKHLAGQKITQIVIGYDQPGNTGGYRGLIDNIRIGPPTVSAN